MSPVILGGKQTAKFANARNRGWLFIFSQNEKILVSQMYSLSFDKFYVITVAVATASIKITMINFLP